MASAAGMIRPAIADPYLPAMPAAPSLPSWYDQNLGRVWYSYLGDTRKRAKEKDGGRDDFKIFRINEDGIITGQDFLNQPSQDSLAGAIYEHMLGTHPEQIDPNKTVSQLRTEYRQKLEDRRMAILILNRVLDHEAMKHKLQPEVSDARVDYVLRSILTLFGASSKHLKAHALPPRQDWVMNDSGKGCHPSIVYDKHQQPDGSYKPKIEFALDEDPGQISNEEMYGWLKKAVGGNQLSFQTDWSYVDRGLYVEHDHLHDKPDLGWPMENKQSLHLQQNAQTKTSAVAKLNVVDDSCTPVQQEQSVQMKFEKLPEDWHGFREAIRLQLQDTYRQYMRLIVWKALIQDKNPLLSWQSMFAATTDQFDAMYAALKDTPVLQIPRKTATFAEVRAEGPKAPDFKKRYLELLAAGEAKHASEFSNVDASAAATPQGAADWIARIAGLRRSIQSEAYMTATVEFASSIMANELRASSTERTLSRGAADAVPEDASFASAEQNAAFDMDFFTQKLITHLEGVDADDSIKIMTMIDLKSTPDHRAKDDAQVHEFLRMQIESRLKGQAFRQLAFDLFRLNPFEFTTNLCRDGDWPCSYADDKSVAPRLLAEALFPETLYPGQKLPTFHQIADAQGNPQDVADVKGQAPEPRYSSTLNHPEFFDKVQAISVDNLTKVFATPNDHVDYDVRFHNND